MRLCLGAFRTSPIDSLQVEANEPSLTLRREQLSLQYAVKLQANPKNPAYSAVFEPKYEPLFGAKPRSIPPFGIRIATALHSVNPHNIPICKFAIPPAPPWTLTKPTVLLDLLSATTKGNTAPEIYLSKFREILSFYPDRQAIYTDGSKVGDRVACAAVSNTVTFNRRLPDGASIYSAELTAILLALDLAKRYHSTKFFICTDSLSALEAIQNRKLDQPFIQEIYSKLSKLTNARKSIFFLWTPGHIGIAGNERADKAAKEALKLDIFKMPLPWTDFKPKIKQLIQAKWQEDWNTKTTNKLHSIKPKLGPPTGRNLSRHCQTVLCRARIGHTHLTHGCLLRREARPQCTNCNCPLTVEHILLQCSAYSGARLRHFNASTMDELFHKVPATNILNYLCDVKLLHKF
mgnify:FL=1